MLHLYALMCLDMVTAESHDTMKWLVWTLLTVHSTLVAQGDVNFQPYHVSQKSVTKFAPKVSDHAYFGFSTSSFISEKKLRVVVSAPRDGKIGKLFNCDIDTGNCTNIPDPDILVTRADNIKDVYKQHNFWLGATVKGHDEMLLACAPLSVESALCPGETYATYGQCFKFNNESKILNRLNLITTEERKKDSTTFEQCMDSFGWSIDISRYRKVLVGGPAMTAGRVMSYNEDDILKTTPKLLIDFENLGRKKVNFNFGYSIAYGNFLSDSPVDDSAISSPYGEKGVGKVLVFSGPRQQGRTIEDPSGQVGSLFGASLCAARLNSTSPRAHLLVGAPGFAHNKSLTEYNRGAVYIYVPSKRKSLSKYKTILGLKDGGFFGSAITNVGDLDGDGSDDVAIAAPFEESGRGAVYIYLGSDLMQLNEEAIPKQRIYQEGYRAFGLSLSALNDYDSNGCKELVVGAPGSMVEGTDQVAVVRCMAWIRLNLRNDFSNLKNRKNDTYFDFDSCMDVTYPKELANVKTTIAVSVNIIHPNATLDGGESKMTYKVEIATKKPVFCRTIRVLTPVDGEYDKTIGIEVTAIQTENPFYKEDFDPSYVVICDSSKLYVRDNMFVGNCSHDRCVPILKAEIISELFTRGRYVIGSTESESFGIEVANYGDVAYSSCLVVTVIGAPIKSMPRDCENDCNGETNCQRVHCRPPSRLLSHQTWKINDIVLDTSTLNCADESISVNALVYTDCSNASDATPVPEKTIQLQSVLSGVSVHGKTDPAEIINITQSEVEKMGAHFQHQYIVQNAGPTNLAEFQYELSVKKIENYEYSFPEVRIDSKPIDCEPQITEKDDVYVAFCEIDGLKKENQLEFLLPIDIRPGSWFDKLKEKDIVIDSQLRLFFNSSIKTSWNSRVSTTLRKLESIKPWWVILLAIIIGLILIGIVLFLLYRCGLLQRKNKENLKDLKREVRRQSVRRSIRERDSMRSSMKNEFSDVNKLCEGKSEDENDIDIREVQNDGCNGNQQPKLTVADVHAQKGGKCVEYTNM